MPVEHAASLGHLPLLDELAVITAVSVGVMVLFARFRLPTVTGLLFAGALLGPFGFKWVKSIQAIEVLAEVGVVLLLFSIGLEFSLQHLKNIFQKVALGGLLQVGLTTAATFGVAKAFGLPSDTAPNLLNATIYRLRRRLDRDTKQMAPLQTKSRLGYVFRAPLVRR